MKTLYFVAGEPSADNHGAAVMKALRARYADVRFVGCGGPEMRTVAGDGVENWISRAGVLGLWEVLKQYGYFRRKFYDTLQRIEKSSPDAVILIDYPGFNLRLARALRRRHAAAKVIYYISPQVWAWNRGRIHKMARWIDLMLCIFPFESELYSRSGLRTVFVGHPMIDRLRARRADIQRDPNLVGLFPGSRRREVRKILPLLIKTAQELRRAKPALRFEISAASADLRAQIQYALDRHPQGRQLFTIRIADAPSTMQRAYVGIVASGSATLEAAYFRLPFVLVYKVAWLTYLAARLVVRLDSIGMPNVLAKKQIVPEYIQHEARPGAIARAVLRLINNAVARQRMLSAFNKIVASLGEAGASERAAQAILDEIR
ncbi:MAG TPA: lipid-A-disaccharide synthase [Chthoniobacterales bacterium]|jgi:lipid-A-disaccharide synthase|nr:lipid-A-disaccharide synthase [Chthoniobacterales bacterium]